MSDRERTEPSIAPPVRRRSRVLKALAIVMLCGLAGVASWLNESPTNSRIRTLWWGNASERRDAARELGDPTAPDDDGRTITALTGALHDADAGVRAQAALSLGMVLEGLVSRGAPAERVGAVRTALVGALKDPDSHPRAAAVLALGAPSVASGKLVPGELITVVLNDPSPDVRTSAARMLARFRDDPDHVIPLLFRAKVRDGAALGLPCPLCIWDTRPQPHSLPSPAMIPVLIDALKSPSRDVRFHAARSLQELGTSAIESVPALVAALNETPAPRDGLSVHDASWDVPNAAAGALAAIAAGTTRSGEAVAALTAGLHAREMRTRAGAAYCLAKFGAAAERAIPDLITLLKAKPMTAKPTADEAVTAAATLGTLAPNTRFAGEVVTALTAALKSESTSLQFSAVGALGKFGGAARPAISELRALRAHADRELRYKIDAALQQIDGRQRHAFGRDR
jgi:HEAT repeat protein